MSPSSPAHPCLLLAGLAGGRHWGLIWCSWAKAGPGTVNIQGSGVAYPVADEVVGSEHGAGGPQGTGHRRLSLLSPLSWLRGLMGGMIQLELRLEMSGSVPRKAVLLKMSRSKGVFRSGLALEVSGASGASQLSRVGAWGLTWLEKSQERAPRGGSSCVRGCSGEDCFKYPLDTGSSQLSISSTVSVLPTPCTDPAQPERGTPFPGASSGPTVPLDCCRYSRNCTSSWLAAGESRGSPGLALTLPEGQPGAGQGLPKLTPLSSAMGSCCL